MSQNDELPEGPSLELAQLSQELGIILAKLEPLNSRANQIKPRILELIRELAANKTTAEVVDTNEVKESL